MADKKKNYNQLKEELDTILLTLEENIDDIDKAIEQYKKAQRVIADIESYLDGAKAEIETLKPARK